MDSSDELTVLRLIADSLTNGDYDSDPEQWKELAKSAREIRYNARPCRCRNNIGQAATFVADEKGIGRELVGPAKPCPCKEKR